MSAGLQQTWDLLATSRNRAVLRLLAHALNSRSAGTRAHAIRTIVERHDIDSHRLLIHDFAKLTADDQAIVCQADRAMPHQLAAALTAAVLGDEPELCPAACQIITLCEDYDLFPVLVQAAENPAARHATAMLDAISRLANTLHQGLADRSEDGEHDGRDPAFVRRNVLAALERSLANDAEQRRPEILEAYLLLAPASDGTFSKMLHDTRHPCHAAVCEFLTSSSSPGLIERLVEIVRNSDAPQAVLQAVSHRTDRPFVERLLSQIKHPVPWRVLHNMKQLRFVAWLEARRDMLLEFDGRAQAVAVELATASSITQEALFDLLAMLLKNGLAEGRRTSCAALTRFNTPEANQLVRLALDDPDSGVQAAAVRQLRRRGFADALDLLVSFLDSSAGEVRDTARSLLAEFNFVRYCAMFDLLDDDAARSTGLLVHKVDHAAVDGLLDDLASPSVSTRLRAIEMAVAMQATDDVSHQLLALTTSDNAMVRQSAVEALGYCSAPNLVDTLKSEAKDPHQPVSTDATYSLQRLP